MFTAHSVQRRSLLLQARLNDQSGCCPDNNSNERATPGSYPIDQWQSLGSRRRPVSCFILLAVPFRFPMRYVGSSPSFRELKWRSEVRTREGVSGCSAMAQTQCAWQIKLSKEYYYMQAVFFYSVHSRLQWAPTSWCLFNSSNWNVVLVFLFLPPVLHEKCIVR